MLAVLCGRGDTWALTEKAIRLKQAKEEADAEIEAYRRKKEEEFQQSMTKVWAKKKGSDGIRA